MRNQQMYEASLLLIISWRFAKRLYPYDLLEKIIPYKKRLLDDSKKRGQHVMTVLRDLLQAETLKDEKSIIGRSDEMILLAAVAAEKVLTLQLSLSEDMEMDPSKN